MKRLVFVIGLALCLLPMTSIAQVMNDNFIFPIVARTPGAANTMWKTEVCVTNPWDTQLYIMGGFVQGGTAYEGYVEFPPMATYCTQDLITDWLGVEKWTGAFYLWAPPEMNEHTSYTSFAAVAKVYNDTPIGTFGTSVPVGQYIPAAWSVGRQLEFGFISGVHNWGTLGESGFRTSVGIFNPASFPQNIDVGVYDGYGNLVWAKNLTVAALTVKQFSVPKNVQFASAAGVGINNGGSGGTVPVLAYATVVDNRTGDGVFKSAMTIYENNLKSMPNEDLHAAQEEHMREIFENLLSQENPRIRRAGERLTPGPGGN